MTTFIIVLLYALGGMKNALATWGCNRLYLEFTGEPIVEDSALLYLIEFVTWPVGVVMNLAVFLSSKGKV